MKVNINPRTVLAKVQDTFRETLPLLSEIVLQDCNEYCKEDSGTLKQSSMIHSKPEEGKLIWQTPYARRQYWEIRTAYTDVNPNASWKWCEVAKRNHSEQWARQAQALFRSKMK